MYQRDCIGLEEARVASEAIIKEAAKKPERPIAVAVVDNHGDLVYFVKQDGAWPLFIRMAINKAYTATGFSRHTREWAERQTQFKRNIVTWGDSRLTDIAGGLVFKNAKGITIGAVGVSGCPSPDEDEELAYVGFNKIKGFWNTP